MYEAVAARLTRAWRFHGLGSWVPPVARPAYLLWIQLLAHSTLKYLTFITPDGAGWVLLVEVCSVCLCFQGDCLLVSFLLSARKRS